MWLIRSVLVFVIIVAVLVFAIGNVEYRTPLRLFTRTYPDVQLNLVLLGAALFGGLAAFLAMIFREVRLRAQLRRLRKEKRRLEEELTALRNLPLDGLERPHDTSVSPR